MLQPASGSISPPLPETGRGTERGAGQRGGGGAARRGRSCPARPPLGPPRPGGGADRPRKAAERSGTPGHDGAGRAAGDGRERLGEVRLGEQGVAGGALEEAARAAEAGGVTVPGPRGKQGSGEPPASLCR